MSLPVDPRQPDVPGYRYTSATTGYGRIHLVQVDADPRHDLLALGRSLCGRMVIDWARDEWDTDRLLCEQCQRRADLSALPPVPLVDLLDADGNAVPLDPAVQAMMNEVYLQGQAAVRDMVVHGETYLDATTGRRIPPDAVHAPTPPLDAADVTAALQAALELAEVWTVDGGTGTLDDRFRLLQMLEEWRSRGGRLSEVVSTLKDSLVADLDAPREVEGRWYMARRRAKRTGWRKDELRAAVNAVALVPVVELDGETGELAARPPTASEAIDVVWQAADVATGRTKVLRERFGLDLDEYASTTWETVLEEVDHSEIPPHLRPEE